MGSAELQDWSTTSRRRLLRGAGLLVAAGAVAAVRADGVAASNGQDLVLGGANSATNPTSLTVSGGPLYGFGVIDTTDDSGDFIARPGIFAYASNNAFITALGVQANGVADAISVSAGTGYGILVQSVSHIASVSIINDNGTGLAVTAHGPAGACGATIFAESAATGLAVTTDNPSTGPGVVVTQQGSGAGLALTTTASSNSATVASISGAGNGAGLHVALTKSTNGSPAISGTATAGAGVHATSATGPGVLATGRIGGAFSGTAAQIRMNKAAAASHPSTGVAGDLFVDASVRLWFCKGGTSWKQLA